MVSGRRARVLWAAPPVLAAVAVPIARALPFESVAAQVVASTLLSFPPWAMAIWALVGLGLALGLRQRWPLAALVGLPLVGLPPGLTQPAEAGALGAGVRVITANVNAYSPDPDPRRAAQALADSQADVVVVIEKRISTMDGYEMVAHNFDDDLPRASHATAIFCRPTARCAATVTPEFGSPSFKMPVGLVYLPSVNTCLMGMHAPPQIPYDPSGMRPHITHLADAIAGGRTARPWGPCPADVPVVVAGDLNHTPHSWPHAHLRAQGLRDALAWTGIWTASWPAGGGWPNLPYFRLDHVLVGDIGVSGVRQHRIPGADHIALSFTIHP